jgi:hypothetical protein
VRIRIGLPHGPAYGKLALRPFGGVEVDGGLGVGSLILILPGFLHMTFLPFFEGGGVAAALSLPARVLDDLALGLVDESSTDSTLGT